MKKLLVVALMTAFLSPGYAENKIIENPARPANPRAGRVVIAREVLKIEDTGEGFYFKMPIGFQAGDDGTLIVQDGQQQLLSFSPDGRFLKNFFKPGQGPGELTHIMNFTRSGGDIVILGMPPKILHMDSDGWMIREIGLAEITALEEIVGFRDDIYYLLKYDRPEPKGGSAWMDLPQTLVALSKDGKIIADLASFPIPRYVQVMSNGVRSETGFNDVIISPLGSTAWIVNHQGEYLVKIYDAREKRVTVSFRRPYRRVKRSPGSGGVSGSDGTGPQPPEFINDIIGLYKLGDRILVQTSTLDRKKGHLFDVYDREGHYIDAFFLKTSDGEENPGAIFRRFSFAGNFVYFFDSAPDGTYFIKKCSLEGY